MKLGSTILRGWAALLVAALLVLGTADAATAQASDDSGLEPATSGSIGLSTTLRGIDSVAGHANKINFGLVVINFADAEVSQPQVLFDLVATFGAHAASVADIETIGDCVAADPEANQRADEVVALLAPDGALAPGEECDIEVTITVSDASSGPFSASAVATGVLGGLTISDLSTDGPHPDANGNGDPSDDSEPTVIFTEAPPQAELLGASVVNEQFESALDDVGPARASGPSSTTKLITLAALGIGLIAAARRGIPILADASRRSK